MTRLLRPREFASGGLTLRGVWHGPADGPWVVLCEPFAEEAKCARRAMTEVAWALNEAGLGVLRFDYRGCGDSEGDFEQFDLEAWRLDLRCVVEALLEEGEGRPWALIGLRLGAVLAAEAACEYSPQALVLVAPVTDGRAYWQENFRRALLQAKLTHGDDFSAAELRRQEQEEYFDLGGWLVSRTMREQIQQVALPLLSSGSGEAGREYAGPCLIVDISAREEPSKTMVALAGAYPCGEAIGVRLEPFWQRTGLVDAAPLAQVVGAWLSDRLTASQA